MATLNRVQRGETYAGYTDLTIKACPVCGVVYAAPTALFDHANRNPDHWWYCPNGHHLHFPGPTEEDRLRDQVERERQRAGRLAAERDQAAALARAQKGRATRFKNDRDRDRKRVANGVCPCCKRTFVDLARHMASQHPEFSHDHQGEA